MEKRIRKNFNIAESTVKALAKMKKETGQPASRLIDLAVKKAKGKKLYV